MAAATRLAVFAWCGRVLSNSVLTCVLLPVFGLLRIDALTRGVRQARRILARTRTATRTLLALALILALATLATLLRCSGFRFFLTAWAC